jgi:protein-S-isoprenylcysteine O-methyltransferase Ste14/lysophospholipase L1-like esterase
MRILIPMIVIPVIVLLLYLLVPGLKEQPWTALRIGGAILAAIAYSMVITARVQLGKSFSVRAEAKELVTHGLYARIRNPMYVSVDLMVFGLILALHLYWVFVIFAVFVVFQARQPRGKQRDMGQPSRRKTSSLALVLFTTLVAAGTGAFNMETHAIADGIVIRPGDPNLRYIGHWDKSEERAITVNSGSRVLCRFTGSSVKGLFGTKGITSPAQIYAILDGALPVLYRVDSEVIDFTPHLLSGAQHSLEIDVKDVDEEPNRWNPPLEAAVIFKGLILDVGAKTLSLPVPPKLKMEFYGDSITQGILLLSKAPGPDGSDATKDYAFLTARAFDALHNQVGFGRQGVLREGSGEVPPAPQSFGWNYKGSRADRSFIPDVVVVNHGTNDLIYSSEQFLPAYRDYIKLMRQAYPRAFIFCLRPFGGYHETEIESVVESLADTKIIYVDTTRWLVESDYTDGIHPSAPGHFRAARELIRVIATRTHRKVVNPIE